MSVRMNTTYFSREEAQGKIGKIVISLVNFAGIPQGSRGRVIEKYSHGQSGQVWGVMVEWSDFKPLKDGFSKDEYEKFLEEVS